MPHSLRTALFAWLTALTLMPFWPIAWGAGDAHEAVYLGKHRLGSNRVTWDERVGLVEITKRDGALYLKGRVERGAHWLELEGKVEVEGPLVFHLDGVIRGVPEAFMGEAARQRRTEGRFTFRVRDNRKFWRLYLVDGKDCVCDDNCGNDFCYIDVERAVLAESGVKP